LNKSSGSEIIERHLAPFLLNWTSGPAVAASIHRGWTTVIVVPLPEPTLPRALLSQFLRDGLDSSEGMLFVCGNGWTDAGLEALALLSVFYGVAHAILRDCADVSPAAALLAAATATDAQRLLLLGPGTIGRTPGWRQDLYAALDEADGATCISPTVVYEDNAVRFGGSDRVERLDVSPYARIKRRLAGMPVSLIRATEIKPSATVSVACCLVRRDVLPRQAAVAMATSPPAQEVALSMLMKQSGVALAWLPLPQVYAADLSTADMNENTVRVAHLAEGWCLRARLEG
jgi:hypothetical protein